MEDRTPAWMHEGSCRCYPPDAFFPHDGVGVDAARKICAECPVQQECLEYALVNRIDHGVWGGCWCMGFHAKGEGWGKSA